MAAKKSASKKAVSAQSARLTKQAQSSAKAKVNAARSQNASSKRMTQQSKYNAVKNYETGTTVYKKKTGK